MLISQRAAALVMAILVNHFIQGNGNTGALGTHNSEGTVSSGRLRTQNSEDTGNTGTLGTQNSGDIVSSGRQRTQNSEDTGNTSTQSSEFHAHNNSVSYRASKEAPQTGSKNQTLREAGDILGHLTQRLFQANESWLNLTGVSARSSCLLRPAADDVTYQTILQLLVQNIKLLEYHIHVVHHVTNPLRANTSWAYKLDQWARVGHSHGITILSLAFNYGVLSLMTLSFGVGAVDVRLEEEPWGCLQGLDELQKMELLLDLSLRDFNPGGEVVITEGSYVCHQVIKNVSGYAKFTDQCCYLDTKMGKIHCMTDMPNTWLHILEKLMAAISVVVIFFGPLASPSLFSGAGLEIVRYIVKLKEPLYKTMCILEENREGEVRVRTEHRIDLCGEEGLKNCEALCRNIPANSIIPIKVSEYNIFVSYEKLLSENKVPVGFWSCLIRAIFMCKMQSADALQGCCDANMYGCLHDSNPVTWISVCRVFGRILMVLFLPFPFYIRIMVYFMFEEPEVLDRQVAAANTGLPIIFEYRLLQYLTPMHPFFFCAYVMYYISGITLAFFSTRPGKSRFQKVIIDSFRDMADLSWLNALGMVAKNFLWPFKRFGIFGLLIGIVYWPLAIPVSLFVAAVNSLPLVFLSWRMLFHALGVSAREEVGLEQVLPGQLHTDLNGLQMFETDTLLSIFESNRKVSSRCTQYFLRCQILKVLMNLFLAVVSILTFYAVMVMVTECASFMLHICIFTMMGLIINASKVLKYGALIFMVVLYSYDCYNNVYLQYLKLNKALFSEIKGRIKDISEVTSLPSYLQENRGFKSQENSDQAEYESADDLTKDNIKHWTINDLVLFIDNNDIPRIPKKLFEEVCDIQVPGSPGPVYISLLIATGKFFLIIIFLLFVFIVVLSFGDVYKVSSTNQMLATMAGGFMPFIFSNLLKPAQPAIELGSVSFKSKLEEIVINFWQCWPMYDLKFEIEEEPEEKDDDDDGSDNEDSKKKDKGKKGDKNGSDKKKDTYKKQLNMSEMLGHVEYIPSKGAMLQKLNETKTFRPADNWYADIVVVLPSDMSGSRRSSTVSRASDERRSSAIPESEPTNDYGLTTFKDGGNGYLYGANIIDVV